MIRQNNNGENVILPILYDTSIDELKKHCKKSCYKDLSKIQFVDGNKMDVKDITILLARKLLSSNKPDNLIMPESVNNKPMFDNFFEEKNIKRTVCTFIQDTYIHFKDKSLKPMQLWQDNLNESEDHIRYSTNNLVSPPLALIGETYISDESYFHKWLVAQGGNELLERASITIDVDVIYAYDNVDKVEKSSEDGEVHGVLINSTMYLRESEIKQVARLIKDEKLRNRVLTLMRSHRRIVSAPEKENRNIREIASAQMLGQG